MKQSSIQGRSAKRLLALGTVAIVVGAAVTAASLLGGGPVRVRESPVTAMDLAAGPANNSAQLSIDPSDDRFAIIGNRLDAPEFSCALQASGDSGLSWRTLTPVPTLPAGAEKCYAPEVGFDQAGVMYYMFVGLAGRGNRPMGVYLTTSTDRGRTFSPPWQVLGPLNFGVRMAIDGTMGPKGRIHLVWLNATSDPPTGGFGPPPNPILAAYSDDGGRTFSEPVQVSDPSRKRVVAPTVVLGPNHAVHAGYFDLGEDAVDYQGLEGPPWDGTWSVVVATSPDGGRHFEPGKVVDDGVVPSERVMLVFTMPPISLAADTDHLCASWSDARSGDPDIYLRCSAGRGQRWGKTRRVNDDPLQNGRTQYLPMISFSTTGRLDIVFYDRREDQNNYLNRLVYTYSTDGGDEIAEVIPLSAASSPSSIGQQYANVSAEGQVEFGARVALVSRPDGVLAAWTDTRNSMRFSTNQDLVAAHVELPRGGAPLGKAPIVGAGTLLIGLLFVGVGVPWARRRNGAASGSVPAPDDGPEVVPQNVIAPEGITRETNL